MFELQTKTEGKNCWRGNYPESGTGRPWGHNVGALTVQETKRLLRA